MDFEEDFTRRNFIKKVYLILGVQLVVTLGLVWTCVASDQFYEYVEENPKLLLLSLVIVFVALLVLMCCSTIRRTAPFNFIFLAIFTLAESFFLGVVATQYDPTAVIMALGLTALISVVLSLYAMQTKVDYTAMGGFLLICVLILVVFSLVTLFFRSLLMMMIYCSIGVLMYSIFLIYDTQLMMGGNHAYSISPDEYVFAALNLYIDIVYIFLLLLHIIGAEN